MVPGDPVPVRERSRRAVRAELTLLAQDLFIAQGYDETTVEDICEAAGMSRRTFFRYFASKDDLVLGKNEIFGEQIIEAFAARPADEPAWTALRRAFDPIANYFDDQTGGPRAIAMQKIIQANPVLTARYLERATRVQDQLAAIIRERAGRHDPADPRPAAIAGAALSCLITAQAIWIATGQPNSFADLLDQAMAALTLA
jgi:AcrR family transcriptional regulator